MKRALILGIWGQDGSYMAELLASKGYEIYGVEKGFNKERLDLLRVSIPEAVVYQPDLENKEDVFNLVKNVNPDEVYNFAGISDIFNPWNKLDEIFKLNALLPQYFLEVIKDFNKNIKYFQASSCLIFGKDQSGVQNEKTPANPALPYGVAKLYADNMIKEFRREFGLYACSGIFYNHESPRRGANFFTKKISNAVKQIKKTQTDYIEVGSLSDLKDYGYAPDFMEAVYLMMHNVAPKDYVIGTAQLITNEEFIKKCFNYVNLDYQKYIKINNSLIRKNDLGILKADISEIKKDLNWKPQHSIDDLVSIMMEKDY